MKRLAIALIERYQRRGGGRHYFAVECNFEPTCSEYTRQAIMDQGTCQGVRLGWRRIKRCTHTDLSHKINDPYVGSAP